ncbi:MAG: T9SS type A sorting domain-containing protein [Bacteroidia bacterium]|nr:T9SS type A sorting domain-containing protein [Bacteroidia bacterium]
MTNLDVSAHTALVELNCNNNLLTNLDVSANTTLTYLECGNNQLTSLNVKNGNNTNFIGFDASNNPNLTCIQVDDTVWANANWTVANGNIDSTMYFSNDCGIPVIAIEPNSHSTCTGSNTFLSVGVTGTEPVSYQWYHNNSLIAGSNNDTLFVNSATLADTGNYYCVVTNAYGGDTTATAHLSVSTMQLSFTATNVLCHGANTGAVDLTVSNGILPYSFSWSGGQTTEDINGIAAGLYYIQVTDGIGCIATDSIIITQTDSLFATITTQTVSCYNGTDGLVFLNVTGGTPGYTYIFSNCNCSAPPNTAGNYTVTITDVNGCSNIEPFVISQPDSLVAAFSFHSADCWGDSTGWIDLTVTGGTMPYTYQWTNGMNTEDIDSLPAGNYSVIVTDANFCIIAASTPILQPSQLYVQLNSMDETCFGLCNGSIETTVSGGTMPYTYLWSNSDTNATADSLCPGTYNLTITDINNCTVIASDTVNGYNQLSILLVNVDTSFCNQPNGSATISVIGGVWNFTYQWPAGVNSTTSTADSLLPGVYTVTVTDSNGCIDSLTITIINQMQPSAIQGTVHYSGGIMPVNSSMAELYKIISSLNYELVGSVPVDNSSTFSFLNVEAGDYIIRINIIDSTGLTYVVPTYYDSSYLWNMADTIFVACDNTYPVNIQMYEIIPIMGLNNGSVLGTVVYAEYTGGKGITAVKSPLEMGNPVNGGEIYIELEPDDEPVANTTTDTAGNYAFTGLAENNTYSVHVEIPGFPLITTYENLFISSANPVFFNLNFIVDTTGSDLGIYADTVSVNIPFSNAEINSIHIYPNPFSEKININCKAGKPCSMTFELTDAQGKILQKSIDVETGAGEHKYTFDTRNYTSGTYYLKISAGATVYVKKMVLIK